MNTFERNVPGATFHIGDVGSVQARPRGQFFLRYPEFVPVKSDRSAKLFLYINLSHRSLCISHNYAARHNRL